MKRPCLTLPDPGLIYEIRSTYRRVFCVGGLWVAQVGKGAAIAHSYSWSVMSPRYVLGGIEVGYYESRPGSL